MPRHNFSKFSRDFKQPECSVLAWTTKSGKNKDSCAKATPHGTHRHFRETSETRPVWKMSRRLRIISKDFILAFSFSSFSLWGLCLKPIIKHLQERNGIRHLAVSRRACGDSSLPALFKRAVVFFGRLESTLRHTPLGHLMKSGSLGNAWHDSCSLKTLLRWYSGPLCILARSEGTSDKDNRTRRNKIPDCQLPPSSHWQQSFF